MIHCQKSRKQSSFQQSVSANRKTTKCFYLNKTQFNLSPNPGADALVSPLALAKTGLQRMVSCDVERYIAMAEIVDMAGS